MRRGNDRLSDAGIKAWLRKSKTRKLSDGEGLHLVRLPSGAATWRVKYSVRSKAEERLLPRTFSIGPYPRIGLKEARAERDKVKGWLRDGRDPVLERQLSREEQRTGDEMTFEAVAREWLERRRARKAWSAVHYRKSRQALERDILPALGHFPIQRITPRMVTAAFDPIISRGAIETANKQLQNVVRIFARAKALHLLTINPAQDLREELIPQSPQEVHHPALLTFPEFAVSVGKSG